MDLDGVAGEVGEVGCGYLGAAGVVDAEEEDGGFGGHGDCLVGVGSFAGCRKLVGSCFMCSFSYLYGLGYNECHSCNIIGWRVRAAQETYV